jgi:hypothetical protein
MRRPLALAVAAATASVAALSVYRFVVDPWRRTWGTSPDEAARLLPGDELIASPSGVETRAITILAPEAAVWPWLVQMGFGRAGWYSYDLFDNLGRHSSEVVIPELQTVHVGDLAGPMANPPTPTTSFRVHAFETDRFMLWIKGDNGGTWLWLFEPIDDESTRLITRMRGRYDWKHLRGLFEVALVELGDPWMFRKCMLGIKRRAEHLADRRRSEHSDT